MARQGTWTDNIIIQAVANSLNVTINIIESNANFSPVTVINPLNTNGQTTNIYIGHIQEYHYVSTMPVLNSLTPEMTCEDGLIQKSVSSHENIVEQCKESHFLQKKQSELADEEKNNRKGTNLSEADKAEIRKASKREHIQKKRKSLDYRHRENRMRSAGLDHDTDMEQREKFKSHKTSKREFMQKKRAQAVNKMKDNHKRLKLSEVDKAEKHKASKREFMKKKRAQAVNEVKDNHKRLKLSEEDKAEKRKASKREFMQKKRAQAVNKVKDNHKRLKSSDEDKAEKRKASKREYIRKKRQSADYRQQENRMRSASLDCDTEMEQTQRIDHHCETSKRGFMLTRHVQAVNKVKDNYERLKLSEVDKAEEHKTSKTENIQKKRQNMQKQNDTNKYSTVLSDCGDNYANACTSMITKFHDSIGCGPEYICTCCDQLWYKTSVRKCNTSNYTKCQKDLVQSCITGVKSMDNTEWICNTCHLNIREGKLPRCSKANGMNFPDKPSVLDLTPLEERLLSPRIPFMQIRELPRGGQLSIHGNVVNVPSDVNSTVHTLPRLISESQTIPIKFKRRLSYKHHYQFQNVRPRKVLEAVKYLVSTSELYKTEGIEVRDPWQNSVTTQAEENDEWDEFLNNENIIKDSEKDNQNIENNNYDMDNSGSINSETIDYDGHDDDGDWCEVDERPSGVSDTLLQQPEIAENSDNIISFAPGEGNKPLGIFMDKDSEFLSFSTIFCGKRRSDNKKRKVPVSYSTVAKWELRCQDRRAAHSVPNLFYKLKKLQIKQIQDTACISLRKCKTKGKNYTAGDLKSEDYVNELIHLDEGFRVLKNLRGSPAYFQKCKKDLFSMIRQLGNPTWFCSFSAAETRWTHLLKTLGSIVEKKEYSDEEINNMTWQQKSNLIQRDPITCARNFEHMVQLFIHNVLRSDVMPIGQIADYFCRVEFQQRGSPHIHGLFWVKDAPQFGKSSEEQIVSFIDKYVTCQKAHTSEMEELVNLQLHRHAKTCKKMGNKLCRFNFPLPPMQQTIILTPLV